MTRYSLREKMPVTSSDGPNPHFRIQRKKKYNKEDKEKQEQEKTNNKTCKYIRHNNLAWKT